MSNKGLIMSLEGKQAVVLTNSGEFRKVNIKKNSNPIVGEEIYLGSDSYFSNMSTSKWGLIAASILLILVLPMYWQFNGLSGQQQEVAYVNIDINPSIELALNAENEVIKVRGLNNDGTQLVKGLKLDNTDVEQAVAAITDKAEEKGYINPSKENLVVISLAAKEKNKDASKYVALSNTLEKKVEKNFIDNKLNGRVETIKASAVMREEAQELDLSVGKYAVLLSAWDSGLKLTADEIRSKSIAKAIKSVDGDLGMVVGKAHEDKKLDELAVKYSPEITKEKINQKVTKGNKKDQENDVNNKDQSLKIDEENEVHNPKADKDKKQDKDKSKQDEDQEKDIKKNNKDKKDNKNASKEEVKETLIPVNQTNPSDENDSSSNNMNNEDKEVKTKKEKKDREQSKQESDKEKENKKANNGENKKGNKSKNKKVKTPEEPTKPKVPKVETPVIPKEN